MATLKAHGNELFRLKAAAFEKAYMSDGTILKNYGDGWKVYGKVKAGLDPVEVAQRKREWAEDLIVSRPAYARFLKLMQGIGSLRIRSIVMVGLPLLTGDPDGLWAELDDYTETRGRFTFDDILELHDAYQEWQKEREQNKEASTK